ncbi:hypothetical protein DFH28DRAFT_947463 [Melampsora americana]|nr:hypothetical protein DFH28DRAFT_947463 [Melampsora americana]
MLSSQIYLLLSALSSNFLTTDAHSISQRLPHERAPLDFVDLSPHVTGNRTFYLKSPYTRSMEAKIYDSNGEVAYTVNPYSSSDTSSIHLRKANVTAECKEIKLSNCPSLKFPTLFHSSKSGEWTVENDTEKHSTYDPLFTRKSEAGPVGPIYDSSVGNITLAEISARHKPPKHVPQGEYYSVHIPADRGHDPFISPVCTHAF